MLYDFEHFLYNTFKERTRTNPIIVEGKLLLSPQWQWSYKSKSVCSLLSRQLTIAYPNHTQNIKVWLKCTVRHWRWLNGLHVLIIKPSPWLLHRRHRGRKDIDVIVIKPNPWLFHVVGCFGVDWLNGGGFMGVPKEPTWSWWSLWLLERILLPFCRDSCLLKVCGQREVWARCVRADDKMSNVLVGNKHSCGPVIA
jgi:hypothetical protein